MVVDLEAALIKLVELLLPRSVCSKRM